VAIRRRIATRRRPQAPGRPTTIGSPCLPADWLLERERRRLIERKSDWHAWKTLLREAGVREVRLHDGRHTAATLLLSAGVHPRVVMEVLGHAQMRTTTDTYSHVMPALGRDGADRIGKALWD
jgi:integrase